MLHISSLNYFAVEIHPWDVPIGTTHPQYPFALKVFDGYWREALDMNVNDQWEYLRLVKAGCFFMKSQAGEDIDSPINHLLFKDLLFAPTMAKYIFMKSLFGEESMSSIDSPVIKAFQLLETHDPEKDYRTHHPDLSKSAEHKADSQPQRSDGKASGKAQTPSVVPPNSSRPKSGSREHISANRGQGIVSSLPGRSWPVVDGQASLINNQTLTQCDLKRLEK